MIKNRICEIKLTVTANYNLLIDMNYLNEVVSCTVVMYIFSKNYD